MPIAKYKNSSLYASTPIKTWYLDVWDARSIEESGDDSPYIIPSEFDLRPDLASFHFYGTPAYWYVFALRNKGTLKDPIYDFKAGVELYVPSERSVKNLL